MALYYEDTEINAIKYNNKDILTLIYNGTTVFSLKSFITGKVNATSSAVNAARSYDGKNWFSYSSKYVDFLVGNNVLVSFEGSGTLPYYSLDDGNTWNQVTSYYQGSSSSPSSFGSTIFYKDTAKYIDGKFIILGSYASYNYLFFSDDGITWTRSTSSFGTGASLLTCDCYYKNNIAYVITNNGIFYSKKDITSRTSVTFSNPESLFGNNLTFNKIDFINGYFVVYSTRGDAVPAYSRDGENWYKLFTTTLWSSDSSSSGTLLITCIGYRNSKYYICAGDLYITESLSTSPTDTGVVMKTFAISENNNYIYGLETTEDVSTYHYVGNFKILNSNDVEITTELEGVFFRKKMLIAFTKNKIVFIDYNNGAYYSEDGENFSKVYSANNLDSLVLK